MDTSSRKIFDDWKKRRPTEVPYGDVSKVVDSTFPPSSVVYRSRGSHMIVIDDPLLKRIEAEWYSCGLTNGTISISITNGNKVKWYLLNKLIKAIDVLEEYARIIE